MWWLSVKGQPPLNERLIVNEAISSVFGSIISTDSCYYITGFQTSTVGFSNFGSALLKTNFDGTIHEFLKLQMTQLQLVFMVTVLL